MSWGKIAIKKDCQYWVSVSIAYNVYYFTVRRKKWSVTVYYSLYIFFKIAFEDISLICTHQEYRWRDAIISLLWSSKAFEQERNLKLTVICLDTGLRFMQSQLCRFLPQPKGNEDLLWPGSSQDHLKQSTSH